jgi:integrase
MPQNSRNIHTNSPQNRLPYVTTGEGAESKLKLNDCAAAWLISLDENESSASHIKKAKWSLSRLLAAHGATPVTDFTRLHLSQHLRQIRQAPLAPASIAGIRSYLKSFLKFCYEQEWLHENYGVHIKIGPFTPTTDRSAPEAHILAVLDALPAFIAHRNGNLRDLRDGLTISLSIDSGMRLGELNRIRRKDVRHALTASGPVYHIASYGKTDAAHGRFFTETAELFTQWLTATANIKSQWVFISLQTGNRLLPSSQSRAFDRICKFVGIPIFRSHAVRHRNANQLFDKGIDPTIVQKVLGHKDVTTTLKHYRHASSQVDSAVAGLSANRRQKKSPLADDFFSHIKK